jgi:hypothetical protein
VQRHLHALETRVASFLQLPSQGGRETVVDEADVEMDVAEDEVVLLLDERNDMQNGYAELR